MSKLFLNDLENFQNESSAISTLKLNNDNTEAAMDKALFRDGTAPNQMEADFDMNSNRILNLPAPISPLEPVRKIDLDAIEGVVGASGVLSVQDYGAVGDGIVDDTDAINLAITDVNSYGRGILYFPRGTYLVSEELVAIDGEIDVYGDGALASVIITNNATANVLVHNGSGTIRYLGFDSAVTKTAGYHLSLIGWGLKVRDIWSKRAYVGIYNTGRINMVSNSHIELMTSRNVAADSGGILNEGGILHLTSCSVSGATLTPADMPEYGVKGLGGQFSGELDMFECYVLTTNVGVITTSTPTSSWNGTMIANTWIDSILTRGIFIDSTPGGSNSPIYLSNNYVWVGRFGSIPISGIEIKGASGGATLSNNSIVTGTVGSGVGLYLNTSLSLEAVITGNRVGGIGTGFSTGIYLSNNSANYSVVGNSSMGNTGYGIYIGTGNTNGVVSNNNLHNNTLAAMSNNSPSGSGMKVFLNAGNTDTTGTGSIVLAQSPAMLETASVVSTTAGAAVGPILSTWRNKTPSANDLIGTVDYSGQNSAAAPVNYARAIGKVITATAGAHEGQMIVQTPIAGAFADRWTVGRGVQIGAPTGGDKGTGTLNAATQIYVNNAAVHTGSLGATDNAALRADGTGGTIAQASPLIIADTTGALTRSGGGGIPIQGTNSNVDPAAGFIGEYIFSNIPGGSAVPLTSNTAANVTSIQLTAGNWLIWGSVSFTVPGGTTTTTIQGAFIHDVSATLPVAPNGGAYNVLQQYGNTGANTSIATGTIRKSYSAALTTVYLIAFATFAVSTQTAYGFIGAIRLP